jgi:hypothetical protein
VLSLRRAGGAVAATLVARSLLSIRSLVEHGDAFAPG